MVQNMSSGTTVSVSDVAAMRALAHPTRLDLLDLLRTHESLTAPASDDQPRVAGPLAAGWVAGSAGEPLILGLGHPRASRSCE